MALKWGAKFFYSGRNGICRGVTVPFCFEISSINFNLSVTRGLKIDHKNMSPLDVEKELFKLKRQMGAYYSKAAYGEALKVAKELHREVVDIMGSNNAVNASCLNNIGLMQKMLGDKEAALEKYNEALAIYEEVVGRNHMSYISTSANIGVLYKSMAESAQSKEEYWKYLDMAEDILKKSLAGRIDLHGPYSKDVLINQNQLANILRCRGKLNEAEEIYTSVLRTCRSNESMGNWDSVTALTLNNLGLLLKQRGQIRWTEAENCYKEAISIRTDTLGENHQDTIVSMHNLAEFYICRGKDDDQMKAASIQQKILDVLGKEYKSDDWSDDAVYDSLPLHTKHGEVAKRVEKVQDEMDDLERRSELQKRERLDKLGEASAPNPAGSLGGYYPGVSTLPPPRSPVTAYVRGVKSEVKNDENPTEKSDKLDDDVLRKLYESMMNRNKW